MEPSSRDRISVDLHGLKAPLMERAQAVGLSPSHLVRQVLAEAAQRGVTGSTVQAFLAAIHGRPAYQRALEKGGPGARLFVAAYSGLPSPSPPVVVASSSGQWCRDATLFCALA